MSPSDARSSDPLRAASDPLRAASDPLRAASDALDAAIDAVTGVPSDDGEIERFTHSGMTLVAEARGDVAAEQTFVLLHGIGMGRHVFADLVQHLRPHGRVIALDLPGYGEAPEPPRTPTVERTADLVAAFVRHGVRGPAVVIGHSMGTQVATEVAVRHPSLVSRVVLVAPTVDRRRRRALVQLVLLGLDLFGESPKVLLLGAREYLRAGPNLRGKVRAMLTHRPEDSYPSMDADTLIIRGKRDLVCSKRWCDEVAAAIPRSRLIEIDGHAHETLIRDARPAASEILRFTASQRPR